MTDTELNLKDLPLEKRALWWFLEGEVGESSKAILATTLDIEGVRTRTDYPGDSGDFARCRKLLDLIPECRASLESLMDQNHRWRAIAPYWDVLDRLYDDSQMKAISSLLQSLR